MGDPVLVNGGRVTSNYFDTLGVPPIRGRTFLTNEEETADVAVVTEAFWRKRLGGDVNGSFRFAVVFEETRKRHDADIILALTKGGAFLCQNSDDRVGMST